MNRIQAQILVDFAEFLLHKPRDHKFNMKFYADEAVSTEQEAVECGAACCILGWGALINEQMKKDGWALSKAFLVRNGKYTSDSEEAGYFGLTLDDRNRLFYEGFTMSPKQKARQIYKVLDSYGWTAK